MTRSARQLLSLTIWSAVAALATLLPKLAEVTR